MKIGTKLTAIDRCELNTRNKALTIGKEYEVIAKGFSGFSIKNDQGDNHYFGFEDYGTYFQSITPESLEELGFEKYGDSLYQSKSSKVTNVRLRVYTHETKVWIILPSTATRVVNCHTLTDLKHLIRILGV